MSGKNITDIYSVAETYIIEYLGNHKFSNPASINKTTLGQYKEKNNICK